MLTLTSSPHGDRATAPNVRTAVGAVAPAVVLVIGMVAAVNLAIPKLQASSLHPSVSGTAWIVDSYTLVFACLLIPAGALSDRFGRTRGMLVGLTVFAAGSTLAALAPSVALLMCGRALSGVGAALVLPATLAATLQRLQAADRPQAVALWSALSGVAGVVGNLGGGLAVQLGGWQILFWAGVPLALASAALIAVQIPAQTPHQDPVDGTGAGLLTGGCAALLYGIIDGPQTGWSSWQVLGALGAAVVLLSVFAVYELRAENPMLDPRLFRLGGVRAGAIGIVALFFGLFGFFYINAQYLQDVRGDSPLLTGVCILPLALAMPYASARSTALAARIGARATVLAGVLSVALALALLSLLTAATPYVIYALMLVLLSGGMGLALPPLSGTMVHALPARYAGVAAGLNSTTRELGSALGVAVLSTLLTTRFAAHLPHGLERVAGPQGGAIRHSITAALTYADGRTDPAVRAALVHGTHDAFLSGTSLGLRVGAVLLALTAALIARQLPGRADTL